MVISAIDLVVVVTGGVDVSSRVGVCVFFFLMIRRPPRSTLDRSSAASDVYKRWEATLGVVCGVEIGGERPLASVIGAHGDFRAEPGAVSYTHLRAHETVLDLVCRLLLEKKKHKQHK